MASSRTTTTPGTRPRRVPGAREQRVGSTTTLLHEDGARVRRTVLPGGLRVVTENVPGVRSAAFGIWVGVGSRDETPAQAGAAHYLEHLLFKGTPSRSALDISASIDAVGGEMNAFTSKEYTCFYARVLDADLPLAVDVIGDLVTSAMLRAADVESERDVILEEIAMRDDDPGDLVHEEFADAMFGPTPLGRPILGTVETIGAITPRAIKSFYTRRYRPENMVIAAAGNVDHAAVVRLVRRTLVLQASSTATRCPPHLAVGRSAPVVQGTCECSPRPPSRPTSCSVCPRSPVTTRVDSPSASSTPLWAEA